MNVRWQWKVYSFGLWHCQRYDLTPHNPRIQSNFEWNSISISNRSLKQSKFLLLFRHCEIAISKKQTSSRSKLNEPHYELISNWGVIINDLCMTTSRERKRIKWLYWNLFGNLWKCLLKLNLTYSNQLDVKLIFFMTSFIKQWRNIDTHKFDWKIH